MTSTRSCRQGPDRSGEPVLAGPGPAPGTVRTRTEQPLLDAAEEVSLARAMEAGLLAGEVLRTGRMPGGGRVGAGTGPDLEQLRRAGVQARERFLLANVRLVAMEVRRALGRTPVTGDDLFQEGALALAESLVRWDHSRGIRFAGYALPWVRNRIRAAAATRVGELESASRAAQVARLRSERTRLTQRLRREPTLRELATEVGRAPAWVAGTLAAGAPAPLQQPDGTSVDVVDPAAEIPLQAAVEPVWQAGEALARLPEPVRTVVRRRYGFDGSPTSCARVAAELGWTAGQVRRLELRGLELLRAVCPSQCRVAA